MSEWISVKDRLPEVGKRVLAVCTFGVEVFIFVVDDCGYRKWIGDYNMVYPFGYIKHWMPLPEPPGEEVDSDVSDQ